MSEFGPKRSRYLGTFAVDPTPTEEGSWWYNSAEGLFKIWPARAQELVLELFPYTAGGGDLHTEGPFGGYRFETGDTGMCYFKGKLPNDFLSFTDCNVIWMGKGNTAGQDWRNRNRLFYSAVGEAYDTHSEFPGDQVIDVTVLEKKYAQDAGFSFTNLAIGDYIYVQVQRKGLEADDTYDGQIYIDYVLITYTSDHM